MKYFCVLCLLLLSIRASAQIFFVATNGQDRWSGTLASPAANQKDGPFASISSALAAARRFQQQNPTAATGATIRLRDGKYELREPMVLDAGLSGRDAQHPFTIEAYEQEHPVLSGGRRITGWKKVPGQNPVWEANVPEVRAGQWYFRQLFFNGERRQRARTPNEGFLRVEGTSPEGQPARLKFKEGDIKKHWASEKGDVELIALLAWTDLRMQIRAVDESNRVATLSGPPRPSNKEANARYYLESAADLIDAPGEWFLDRQTGIVRYWAFPGEDPNGADLVAPRLQDLIHIKGDLEAKKPVRHLVLRGLTFSHTDWTLGTNGLADPQAAITSRGHVLAEMAADGVIEGCTFKQLGGYGLELGRGCQRFRVIGNEMADLAAGGVRVGETAIRPEPGERSGGHTLTDNHLHHLGQVFPAAVGILTLQSGGNLIAHNEIDHLYYTAISVGWTWGYQESPCRDNRVEFNHLHHIGQGRLSDLAAVYTLGPQPGTVVRNNLIHDVSSFTYGGWGLYTDEGSSGILLENNVVYRCKSAGFHQHYGRENIIRNNIFALGQENQVMRTRPEPHISFFFTNNIVYFDAGQLLGSDWSNDHYQMDRNLYFDTRGDSPAMKFAGSSMEEWRQRGHDQESLITDPMFVAPEKGDFRLRPESPAFQLGFHAVDLTSVGVRSRNLRR